MRLVIARCSVDYQGRLSAHLPSAVRRPPPAAGPFPRHRITFEKTGDARFLSHRNTMDVLERAIRAAGLPARYSEGFNPHMKLSMGPALALGLESRHEVFDVEGIAPFGPHAAGAISENLSRWSGASSLARSSTSRQNNFTDSVPPGSVRAA